MWSDPRRDEYFLHVESRATRYSKEQTTKTDKKHGDEGPSSRAEGRSACCRRSADHRSRHTAAAARSRRFMRTKPRLLSVCTDYPLFSWRLPSPGLRATSSSVTAAGFCHAIASTTDPRRSPSPPLPSPAPGTPRRSGGPAAGGQCAACRCCQPWCRRLPAERPFGRRVRGGQERLRGGQSVLLAGCS